MSDKPNYLDLERMVEQVNTYNIELKSKLKAQQLELEKARELIEEILGIENKNKPVVEALKDARGWEVKAKEFLKKEEGKNEHR
jgi:benzoyl-CoA reductase/2-hydroxyglutaryl-CoA dehydratase subunit BcrC/BadD/HgdB